MKKKEKKNLIYYYNVLVASNINHYLIYSSVNILDVGTLVYVSLRKKLKLGCIIKKIDKPLSTFNIKIIHKEYNNKKLTKNLISFLNWFSFYNQVSLGSTLKLFLPNHRIVEETLKTFLYAEKINKQNLSKEQITIINLLSKNYKTEKDILLEINNKKVLRQLINKKLILEKKLPVKIENTVNLNNLKLKKLSEPQKDAYNDISKKIIIKNQKPIFLDGVTGSGKTEIYFHLIRDTLKKKKQVLVLLPEIALSEQWLTRFKDSFGFHPLLWNSKVNLSLKRKIWNAVMAQKALVVVGARSSLFLPFSNLGLVIIDEENDQSYKQEEGVIYNARDMAVLKCKIEKCGIILVSATPSLETFQNCKNRKYEQVKINLRYKNTNYPKIKIIDMKKYRGNLISEKLKILIKKNLKEKKQSLILINRRGYAPVCLCVKCGEKKTCEHCDSSLVYHKDSNLMICHQCGKKQGLRTFKCSNCKSDKFIFVGTGLEKVYEEVSNLFEKAKIIKLSSDYIDKDKFFDVLKNIENNKVDIIIGTQIISKGFDFANLKSVFILDFDIWFNNADIRTNEKVFQLTQQVAGRAGRRKEIGEVCIQTYDPKNNLLQHVIKNQRDMFYLKELKIRKKALLPPFVRLLSVTVSSKIRSLAEEKAEKIKLLFQGSKDLHVLGPIPAQVFYIKNNYRYKLLVKAEDPFIIQNYLIKAKITNNKDSRVKIKFDIDPYNLY